MRSSLVKPADLNAPGAIDALLAFHRQTFGSARMDAGEGGSEGGDGADAGAADQGGDAAKGGADQSATKTDAGKDKVDGKDAGSTWDGKVESLPEGAQKMIRDLRTESADRRTKLSTAEQAQQDAIRALAKAAGIELPGGDNTPDPAELAQKLTTSQATARDSAAELIVWRNASTLKVDPGALTDSRAFAAAIKDFDPSSETFETDVKKAAEDAAKKNPKLQAAQAAASRSGADHAGGSGEGANRKPVSLDQGVASHYGT